MPLYSFYNADILEAGCDEAGRGCLAGPVFAAAVILEKNFFHPLLNDSKQLSEKQRNTLRTIIEREAIAWAVARVEAPDIDRFNIYNASMKAIHEAIEQLNIVPELLLIDGNRFQPYWGIPHCCIVKGDEKYASIAAASILAKTWRDQYMENLAAQYPQYEWQRNKGYPTAAHRAAIRQFGHSPHHRRTFKMGN